MAKSCTSPPETGGHVGIEVKTPFLDEKFESFAKLIDVHNKAGEHDGKKWRSCGAGGCF